MVEDPEAPWPYVVLPLLPSHPAPHPALAPSPGMFSASIYHQLRANKCSFCSELLRLPLVIGVSWIDGEASVGVKALLGYGSAEVVSPKSLDDVQSGFYFTTTVRFWTLD